MFFTAEAVLAAHMADLLEEMQELKSNLLSS